MKQGILVILLIATISVVGYALYQPNQKRVRQLLEATASQETPQPTPSTTPTPTGVAQPTTVIVMPTTVLGPKQLPNTGVLDAGDAWSDSPVRLLLMSLLITSIAAFWLGRRS
jgi:hypothetical protein